MSRSPADRYLKLSWRTRPPHRDLVSGTDLISGTDLAVERFLVEAITPPA